MGAQRYRWPARRHRVRYHIGYHYGCRRGRTAALLLSLVVLLALAAGLTALAILVSEPTLSNEDQGSASTDHPAAPSPAGPATTPESLVTSTPAPTPTASPPPGYRFEGRRLLAATSFCVNPEEGPVLQRPLIEVARDAVDIWQRGAGGTHPLAIGGLCPGVPVEQADGVSVIGWGLIDGPAIGRAVMGGTGGPDQEAGIVLDWSWSSFSDERCLLSVLLHEFGHVLGLGHQEDGTSIMFPVTRCSPELSGADIAAVRFLYP
jgi:hypothetical protein